MGFQFRKEQYGDGKEWFYESDLSNGDFFITPPMEGNREDKSEIEITVSLSPHEMDIEDLVKLCGDEMPFAIHFTATWEHLADYGSTVWMHGMQGSLDTAQSFERLAAEIRKRAYERRNEKWEIDGD